MIFSSGMAAATAVMGLFPPDPKIFQSTPIRPEVADFVRGTNWLGLAGERLTRYGLRMSSWTIGVHSTRLGQPRTVRGSV